MSSVIPEEIEKFSAIADQWWDKKGKFKVLHDFNKPRMDFIVSCIEQQYGEKITNLLLKDKTALDVGCGGGILAESLQNIGLSVTGIDASLPSISSAKIHASKVKSSVTYVHSTLEDYIKNNPKTKHDYIFTMEIIEHVNNPEEFLHNSLSVLRENGLMFLSTINKNIKSLLTAKFAAEYILRWIPVGTHEFKKFISPEVLDEMLERNNAKIIEIKGIDYNIFSRNWYIAKKPQVNYIVCIKKI